MAKNWTEQDYAKAGYRTVKLRLSAAAGEALDKLTEPRRVSAFVSSLILGALEKSTSGKKKRAKPG